MSTTVLNHSVPYGIRTDQRGCRTPDMVEVVQQATCGDVARFFELVEHEHALRPDQTSRTSLVKIDVRAIHIGCAAARRRNATDRTASGVKEPLLVLKPNQLLTNINTLFYPSRTVHCKRYPYISWKLSIFFTEPVPYTTFVSLNRRNKLHYSVDFRIKITYREPVPLNMENSPRKYP